MDNALIKDENLMIFHPKLAEILGLNESILLNQIHYWLNKSNNIVDGKPWVYNSYEAWHDQIRFLSTSTIKKTIKKLEIMGIVLCDNFNKCKMDKTKWYTIDYDKLESFFKAHKDTLDKKEQSTDINNPIHSENTKCNGLKLTKELSNSRQSNTRYYYRDYT